MKLRAMTWLVLFAALASVSFQNCTGAFESVGAKVSGTSTAASLSHATLVNQAMSATLTAGPAIMAASTPGTGYTYGYGPSIIKVQGTYYAYYCSTDNIHGWDSIRLTTSTDLHTWSAPVETLIVSNFGVERAACDPSVVRGGDGYYYMFYGGNGPTEQTIVFVARSSSPMGPFAKYTTGNTWDIGAQNPKIIIHPAHGVADNSSPITYGAGQPSVVFRNNTYYMWYMDDSETYPTVVNRIYLRVSPDAVSWTAPQRTTVSGVGSVDVKFDPATGLWFMFIAENQHQSGSYMVLRTSSDGVNWSDSQTVCANVTCFPSFSNNPGVAGDEYGLLLSHDIFLGYGSPYDPSKYTSNDCSTSPAPNCWAYWNLDSSSFTLQMTGQLIGAMDAVTATSGGATVTGWACAVGKPDQISVQVWTNGVAGSGQLIGTVVANRTSEPGVGVACSDSSATGHRFSMDVSQAILSAHGGQKVFVNGISATGVAGGVFGNSGLFSLPMATATVPISYGSITAGTPISCDSLNPDAIKSLSQDTIMWLASLQPSGLTLHENYLVARQQGYNGAFGHGEHSAWLAMDPQRLANFNAAISALANNPNPPYATFAEHHIGQRAAGYQGLWLCGGGACYFSGGCDSLGRRL